MRVAFRADSSTTVGTGHVARCLSLAEALSESGTEISFLCRDLEGNVAAHVRQRGYEVALLPRDVAGWEEDARRSLDALAGRVDWLVVDNYELDARWESRLRERADRLLVIDDLADRPHDCDALVDQNCATGGDARYALLVPRACQLLLGPRYAILSAALSKLGDTAARDGKIRRILVFFGGTDPVNETGKALEALRTIAAPSLLVDVVVGGGNPHRAQIEAMVRAIPGASCHVQVNDMHERLQLADLALGAGGTSAWERCRAGLPSISVAIAGNQEAPSKALAEEGAILYLGPSSGVSPSDIAGAVRLCLGAPELVRHLSKRALDLVDGRGAARVATMMRTPRVTLRRATIDDRDRMFAWRNDAEVRRHSFDSTALNLDDHDRWLRASLENPARVLLIVEASEEPIGEAARQGSPIGVLRYDLADTKATVSIYLAPGLGGRGFGTEILRLGSQWMAREYPRIQVLLGEIVSSNAASRAAFRAAGYQESAVTMAFLQSGSP